jgi:ubiquinone/menaquinone biosynthesis C-methylase UbiE
MEGHGGVSEPTPVTTPAERAGHTADREQTIQTARPSAATGPLPTGRGPHDWHSATYVQAWVAENEARAATRRAQFDLLADYLPHPADAAISILDVGAGWGPVTRHLLERFPAATATLLDYSEAMLAEARSRLAALGQRVRLVQGDLALPGAVAAAMAAAGGAFDAIVSSSCLHNVWPAERLPALYRELRAATAAGGCFLNLDLVGATGPVQPVWLRARVEQARRQRLAETGTLPSFDEMVAELRARRERREAGAVEPTQPTFGTSGGASRSLVDQLRWLQDAGYDAVECFWRQDGRALLGGYVTPAGTGPEGTESL